MFCAIPGCMSANLAGAWFLVALSGVATPLQAPPIGRALLGGALRPAECREEGAGSSALWARADRLHTARFCSLIAKGLARLDEDPRSALTSADEAEALRPRRPATQHVRALAFLRVGEAAAACQALQHDCEACSDGLGVSPRLTLLRARCSWMAGALQEARRSYQRAVLMADPLDDRSTLLAGLLEAALLSLRSEPPDTHAAESMARSIGELAFSSHWMSLGDGVAALARLRRGEPHPSAAVTDSGSAGPWWLLEMLEPHLDSDADLAAVEQELFGPEPAVTELPPQNREAPPLAQGHADEAAITFSSELDGVRVILPLSELVAVAAALAIPVDPRLGELLWQRYLDLSGVPPSTRTHASAQLGADGPADREAL